MRAIHHTTLQLLILLSFSTGNTLFAQAEKEHENYPTLQGPRYSVNIKGGFPEITWDKEPAPERLVTTSDTVGYIIDDNGQPKLLLTWGSLFNDLDEAYTSEKYFAWALEQVLKGESWNKRVSETGYTRKEDSPIWNGTESLYPNRAQKEPVTEISEDLNAPIVVRITQLNHELIFRKTLAGVTATDNGKPVEVLGANGNYRVYGDDYEAGVAFRQNGKTYQYFKPL